MDEINRHNKYLHKVGVLLQKAGQTTEEELFGNTGEQDNALYQQFLSLLGDMVEIKDFQGYLGGISGSGKECERSVYKK